MDEEDCGRLQWKFTYHVENFTYTDKSLISSVMIHASVAKPSRYGRHISVVAIIVCSFDPIQKVTIMHLKAVCVYFFPVVPNSYQNRGTN